MTVAGTPGAGKSTWLSEFRRDIIELNKEQNFEVLSFEFEMRMEDQLTRDLSSKMDKSVKELYSSETPLSDEDLQRASDLLEEVSSLPIFYVDNVGTVHEIMQTISTFVSSRELKKKDSGLVVTIDHSLLTKGGKGETEKALVDDLYHSLVALKKYYSTEDIRISFVVLSQLNRDIQSNERVTNAKLHYPTQNDLFAASSAYQCSDYVMIIHRPVTISGMGIFYGPPKEGFPQGLPVMCPTILGRSMIYLHLIKERFGKPIVMACVEDFKNNRIPEYNFE